MKNNAELTIFLLAAALTACTPSYDVVVVGGGASGCAAAIEASREGAHTLLVEESPWLGGMLTAAGVSAVDGNYTLRGGIFGEFCDSLAARYGGYEALPTGWVSNIMFDPHVGEEIFTRLTRGVEVRRRTTCTALAKEQRGWKVSLSDGSTVHARIVIDGTELGDVAKMAGVAYRVGMDPRSETGEALALEEGNDLVQDLTYVVTLKDFGPDADMTLPRPAGYDSTLYVNCCENPLNTYNPKKQVLWSPQMMLDYGKTPSGKYMVNWPIEGNDYYVNIVDMSPEERAEALQEAKAKTLGFVYFIQTALGMKNLGIADDEYPSEDGLPFYPYHRESRRIRGVVTFTLDNAEQPYDALLYRTGIAVGDYPVDHHHYAHPQWDRLPAFHFPRTPAFSVPCGVLVPETVDDLLVAEKSVSVSNLVNGTTRLQPVVMELGQAAGALAAAAVREGIRPREVPVRTVQRALLAAGAYLQPLRDIPTDDPDFQALQRIACTGILHFEGKAAGWRNEAWLRAGAPLLWEELFLDGFVDDAAALPSEGPVDGAALAAVLSAATGGGAVALPEGPLTRQQGAVAIDAALHPFDRDVDWTGAFVCR